MGKKMKYVYDGWVIDNDEHETEVEITYFVVDGKISGVDKVVDTKTDEKYCVDDVNWSLLPVE